MLVVNQGCIHSFLCLEGVRQILLEGYRACKLHYISVLGFYVRSHFNRHPVTSSMTISICYWLNYTIGQLKLSYKSETAVCND